MKHRGNLRIVKDYYIGEPAYCQRLYENELAHYWKSCIFAAWFTKGKYTIRY